MRRWCCARRDTRGKRGYDGPWGAGVTEMGVRVMDRERGVGMAEGAGGCEGGRGGYGEGAAGRTVTVVVSESSPPLLITVKRTVCSPVSRNNVV